MGKPPPIPNRDPRLEEPNERITAGALLAEAIKTDGSWNGFQEAHIFGDTLFFDKKETYFVTQ